MNLFEMGKRPDGNWSYLPSSKINHFTFFSSAFARSTNRFVALLNGGTVERISNVTFKIDHL